VPEVTILVNITHISSIIPASANVQGGLLKVIEIPLHHIVPFDQYPAVFARSTFFAGLVVLNSDLNTGNRFADTARTIIFG